MKVAELLPLKMFPCPPKMVSSLVIKLYTCYSFVVCDITANHMLIMF